MRYAGRESHDTPKFLGAFYQEEAAMLRVDRSRFGLRSHDADCQMIDASGAVESYGVVDMT